MNRETHTAADAERARRDLQRTDPAALAWWQHERAKAGAFVVRFGAGSARRYLAQSAVRDEPESGWRRFVWTKDIQAAEIFLSEVGAMTFARSVLGHNRWSVVPAPPRGIPTDDLGGTPAAMRVAA
ncbi:hypothetical protein [Methylobacterium organophilum]|uniref:Uncharacterized protein n=1 Tax=Methylobacterium organophilum TaxID=410 RepID=A0ABQ4TDN0_METOR|nr:hypothetical protein [Methylobacterium organophilum]GJE29791.1 hypothetical protein LKMONMHP_4677 [Methylobacterium organophilum]